MNTGNFTLKALAIACSLALTACGGGGGGGQPSTQSRPTVPSTPSAAKTAADNAIADIAAKAQAVQAALTRNQDPANDGKISATEATAANQAINNAKAALQAAIANAETKAQDAALSPAEKTQAAAALNTAKNSTDVRNAQAASANVQPTPAPAPQPPAPQQPSAATGFGQDNNGRMKPNAGGVSGGVLSTDAMRQSDESSYGSIQNPEGRSKNEVVLNGVKIATATTGQKRYETEESNNRTAKSIHSSDILPDVRYGAVVDTSSGVMAIRQGLFVQGTAAGADTVAVKTGTVEYNGTGLHFGKPSSDATAGLPFMTADPSWGVSAPNTEDLYTSGRATKVKASVNFDNKTIGIDISDPGSRTQGRPNASELAGAPIHFDGVIQGNSFTNAAGQEKTFAGGFYGAAADQLAGMYRLNAQKANESSGVFGAQAGNGGNATPAPAPAPSPAPTPTPTPPSSGAVTESTYYKLPEQQQLTDAKLPMAETNQAISKGIQTLVVDGISIALPAANQGFEKGMNYYAFNNAGNVIAGAAQIMSGGKDQGLLFVQGNLTPQDQIPTGTANYSGKVLHFRERVARHENGNLVNVDPGYVFTRGSFTAQADFANRNLSVTINSGVNNYMRSKIFTANINGNTFSGTGSDRSIEGGFYGANAAAIAGKYQYSDGSTSKWSDSGFGVFSGNKQ